METQFPTQLADLGLGEMGQGAEGAGQTGLGVVEEEVALVLGRIAGLEQVPLTTSLEDGRVVPRGHEGGLEGLGSFQQRREL